ncbi:MAG: DUF4013 domain-containing protein [Halobacteriota archaeon]
MPHCPECGLWVHPADPSCLACDADLEHVDLGDPDAYNEVEGLMSDEVTRGRLQTELSLTEFGFAFAARHGYRPILIGTLLVALSWLVLPLMAFLGYCLNLGNYAAQGRDNSPEMVDIASYMGDGLRVFISAVVLYWLPGLVYLYLVNFYLIEYTHIVIISGYELFVTVEPVGVVLLYLVALLLVFFWPAILTLYTGSINVATTYRPGRLARFIKSRFFVMAVASVFVLAAIFGVLIAVLVTVIQAIGFYIGLGTGGAGIVGAVVALVPLAGIAFVVAVGTMVMFATLGHVYYHAAESVVVPPAE